jgi:cbb3-type cytochrome oxidase maturation protein
VTILYVLVPLGLALAVLGLAAFFWAVDSGQFEDLDEVAQSPLQEDGEG